MNFFYSLSATIKKYPRQYWILLFGNLLATTGSSLVWPFLTIYLRQRLDISLTTVTLLLSLNSLAGIATSFIAGAVSDKFGRKLIMLLNLFAGTVYYVLMTRADSILAYGILMTAWGGFNNLFSVGSNAMIADIVKSEDRTEAYAILRMFHNVGVAAGPAIGGFLVTESYEFAYYLAAIAFLVWGLIVVITIRETLPERTTSKEHTAPDQDLKPAKSSIGFGPVLKDVDFMSFMVMFMINMMAAADMFNLLSAYTKENFGMSESHYGFIVTANALMCILFQYSVTRVTRKYRPLPVLMVGALFYSVGVGSVALGRSFTAFLISMIVMSIGELIMTPTAVALVAKWAPVDMRGRYMSIYGLAWPIGSGVGPILGSYFNDTVAPAAIWYSGMVLSFIAAAGFFVLALRSKQKETARTAQVE
jgi:MFS family permease